MLYTIKEESSNGDGFDFGKDRKPENQAMEFHYLMDTLIRCLEALERYYLVSNELAKLKQGTTD